MDNIQDHTYESANRVYDSRFCAPTIPTCAGGNIQPKVLVKKGLTMNEKNRECLRKKERKKERKNM